jgi:hypothetical protein
VRFPVGPVEGCLAQPPEQAAFLFVNIRLEGNAPGTTEVVIAGPSLYDRLLAMVSLKFLVYVCCSPNLTACLFPSPKCGVGRMVIIGGRTRSVGSEVDANVQKPQVDVIILGNDAWHVQILGDALQITQKRQLAAFGTGACQTERSGPPPMLNAERRASVVSPDEFDHPVGMTFVIGDEGQPDLVEIAERSPQPLAPEKSSGKQSRGRQSG